MTLNVTLDPLGAENMRTKSTLSDPEGQWTARLDGTSLQLKNGSQHQPSIQQLITLTIIRYESTEDTDFSSMAPVPLNSTPTQCLNLLPKLSDADADLRYMSLSDLYNLLSAGSPTFLSTEYHTCAKIIDGILQTLDDQNGEVQNQAIKCVGALVLKLPADILAPFVHRVSNLKTNHSVDTSIPTTALRTFITSFPPPLPGLPPPEKTSDAYSAISRVLIPRLLGYIVIPTGIDNLPAPPPGMLEIGSEKGVNSDAVDLLLEIVRCFGPMLRDAEKQALQMTIMAILDDERTGSVVKKKAVVAISILSVYMADTLLKSFVSQVIEGLRSPHLTLPKRRLLLNMVGSLSRSVPQRLGAYLKSLAPLVLDALSEQEYEEAMEHMAEDGDANFETDEVREAALVALEGFLSCCSNDMRPFTNDAINAALRYVNYDPNKAVEEDDEDMDDTQNDEDDDHEDNEKDKLDADDEDFEPEGAFSDDDDTSWKIRRCAAKALYAIVSTRSHGDLLEDGTLYEHIAPALIKRFKEREENVRLEILATLALLIRKTGEAVSLVGNLPVQENGFVADQGPRSRKRRRVDSNADTSESSGAYFSTMGLNSPALSPSPVSGPRADLTRLSPSIVKGVSLLLKQPSIPSKQTAISLLREIVLVQHGGLSDSLNKVLDPLVDVIRSSSHIANGSTSTAVGGTTAASGGILRIEALQLISAICDTHSSRVLAPYIPSIVPGVITAVGDQYYKVSGEALLTLESITKAITPPRAAGTEQQRATFLTSIYDVLTTKATSLDADLEVRQKAIYALGVLLARTSGAKTSKLLGTDNRLRALNILQDRLHNETTRLSAVKGIELVTLSAADQYDLQPVWVREVTLELGAQLRKADRNLRGASLAALRTLVFNSVALENLDDTTVHNLVALLLPLVNAQDLNVLGTALTILNRLVKRSPKHVVDADLIKALCAVVLSPLGGRVFDAFLVLVQAIGVQGIGQALMHGFLQDVGVSGDPAMVGKAIGTLLVAGDSTVGVGLQDFENELRSSRDQRRQCLALSVLGEAGFRLQASSPLQPQTFTSHFHSKSESVPRAAATALGRAGAGNINTYLPVILSNTTKGGNLQYLSLYSIKEILQNAAGSRSDISPYTKQIWDSLLAASRAEDNKTLGAECIGRITIIDPATVLPRLQEYLRDPTPAIRGMTIQAIRFTFADSDEAFDEILRPMLFNMLSMMFNDPTIENRRLALSTLNAAIHHKADIVFPHLSSLIPLVMKDSKIDPDLIREVQMGPFRHKVDDGLELRKSAYETLFSLMENAYTRMNHADLFDRVIAGLADEHEIKMLCNLMLTKLILLDPEETVRRLDPIAEQFRSILSFKLKENSVKQEVEKAAEASKAALKVTVRLHNAFPAASGAGTGVQAQNWKGYWEWLIKEHRAMLTSMENEVKSQAA
ncbi:MAG: hypothetical protein Q9217_003103 [Psora testacea]